MAKGGGGGGSGGGGAGGGNGGGGGGRVGKLGPGHSDLPKMLRAVSAAALPGAPKGPRVGPLPNNGRPTPPVRRAGGATQRAAVTGRG